jgi:hypothetical protein
LLIAHLVPGFLLLEKRKDIIKQQVALRLALSFVGQSDRLKGLKDKRMTDGVQRTPRRPGVEWRYE